MVRTRYFWRHEYGNIVTRRLRIEFRQQTGGTWYGPRGDDPHWINTSDMIDYLWAGTSLEGIYRTVSTWVVPCCSTFFINGECLLTRTSEEYQTMLTRLQNLSTTDYCSRWRRGTCEHPQAKAYPKTPDVNTFVLGGLFERAWSVIFTGRGNHTLWKGKEPRDSLGPHCCNYSVSSKP
jgi:hypothetical protein